VLLILRYKIFNRFQIVAFNPADMMFKDFSMELKGMLFLHSVYDR